MNFHAGQRVGVQVGGKNQNGTLQALDGWEASLLLDDAVNPIRVSVHDLFPQFSTDDSHEHNGEADFLDNAEVLNQQQRYELRHNIVASVAIRFSIRAAVTARLSVGYRILKNVAFFSDDFNRAELGDKWVLDFGASNPFSIIADQLDCPGTGTGAIIVPTFDPVSLYLTHGARLALAAFDAGGILGFAAPITGGWMKVSVTSGGDVILRYQTEHGAVSTVSTKALGTTFGAGDTVMLLDDGGFIQIHINGELAVTLDDPTPGRVTGPWGLFDGANPWIADDYAVVAKAQEVTEWVFVKFNTRKPKYPPTELSQEALDALRRRDTNYQG